MPEINLADNEGQDSPVSADSVSISSDVRWIDEAGAQVGSRKILRSSLPYDYGALTERHPEPEDLAEALIQGDPEVDLESFGSFLDDTSRVYVAPDNQIVHRVTMYELVRTPDGEVKERRPRKSQEPNVNVEKMPLRWTDKKFPKSELYRKFVFSGKMQISHINGLTYRFLYDMAKKLEDENCMLLIAGGKKGNQPLLFRRGGLAYRGFLEGRTEGKKYALILHLTNMELKGLERPEPEAKTEAGETPPKTDPPKNEKKPQKSESEAKDEETPKAEPKPAAKETTKKATSKKKAAVAKQADESSEAEAPAKKKSTAKKSTAKKAAKKASAKKTAKKNAAKKDPSS